MKTKARLLEELEEKLKYHDWYYADSKDVRVYDNGLAERRVIVAYVKACGEKGVQLYNNYSPYGFENVTK